MSKDDLLNDLEDFIDSDWKGVFKKFQDEEYKKEISTPVIPDYPNYGEFYQSLVDLVTEENIPPKLAFLIHRVLSYQDRKTSSSFDNIWSLFCDPHRYSRDHIKCPHCDHPQAIVYSKEPIRAFGGAFRDDIIPQTHIRQETVHCIKCGTGFYYVAGKVIAVFDDRRIDI